MILNNMSGYDFGSNKKLIIEILDFVDKKEFLENRNKSIVSNHLVTELEAAKEFASEKFYTMFGENGFTWTDLRSKEISKLREQIYKSLHRFEMQSQLNNFMEELDRKLEINLEPPYCDLIEDIICDLSNCIRSRALNGTSNKFFEKIFAAYKSGGWPCGWHGNWPDGELIIFYPPKK